MKRKTLACAEPVIDKGYWKRRSDPLWRINKRVDKCTVCGAECAPNSAEGLCWVCRRLKISAWRDSDQQSVQE